MKSPALNIYWANFSAHSFECCNISAFYKINKELIEAAHPLGVPFFDI